MRGKSASPSTIGYTVTTALTGTITTGTPVTTGVAVGSSSASAVAIYTGTADTLLDVIIEIKIKTNALFSTVKADEYSDTITYLIANGS